MRSMQGRPNQIRWFCLSSSVWITIADVFDHNWVAALGWALIAAFYFQLLWPRRTDPTLYAAGTLLLRKGSDRMLQFGPHDARGVALWDAGCWLREKATAELAEEEAK